MKYINTLITCIFISIFSIIFYLVCMLLEVKQDYKKLIHDVIYVQQELEYYKQETNKYKKETEIYTDIIINRRWE